MKKGLRYLFTRLIILIVAIRILDVSIDIDHLTGGFACTMVEGHDDMDSFSEMMIEKITKNDKFCKEDGTDDRSPVQKHAGKFQGAVLISRQITNYTLQPLFTYSLRQRLISVNMYFHAEDFSSSFYAPPEQATFAFQLT